MAETLVDTIQSTGSLAPWFFLALFLGASALLIWRLEAISDSGFEGTVLGTLIMPYCSGLGNLILAFILGREGGPGREVMVNSLVNNVTNMTFIIGVPAILWGLRVLPATNPRAKKRPPNRVYKLNRLSLLLTLLAVLFFTGAVWALALDGKLDFGDGLGLVGLFLFLQCFHVFDVLKGNVRQNRSFGWIMLFNLALIGVGAYASYVSINWLVEWISNRHTGFVNVNNLGWLSGWLMVLPNALLAFYYAWRGFPEVVYTSQIGDGHICIPLCVGIYALYHPLVVPEFFTTGIIILLTATLVHIVCVTVFGGLPRFVGWLLVAAYGVFLFKGLFPQN